MTPMRSRFTRAGACAIAMILALMSAPSYCQTQGLFTGLYGDRRAREVGDVLHLIIIESSSATVKSGQKTQQQTKSDIAPGIGKLRFIPLMGFSASSQSTADGSSTRGGTMSARMTVQIVEITEGGNLVVEGQRSVNVNHDKETIRIRGEIRAKDVRPDNSIYSYDLANVEINYVGTDPRKPRKKVGIITRLLNLFF